MTSGLSYELGRLFHFDIDEPTAIGADRMVVSVCLAVEAAGAIAKTDLGDVPRIFQKPQAVIDGRETDGRQLPLCRRKNLRSGQVFMRLADNPQNHLTLPR